MDMGFFPFFTSKQKRYEPIVVKNDMSGYLDGAFYKYIVDLQGSMFLAFLEGEGWIWANKTFLQRLSYADIAEFNREHRTIRDIFFSESEEIFTESDKSWLEYLHKQRSDGYSVKIKFNKEEAISEVECYCSYYPNNKNIYILELRDVTSLHNADIAIKAEKEKRTKFLTAFGHEFRTPMNGILGFVNLLKETELNAKQREYLNMIASSSYNLMENIETLLDLTMLESGELQFKNEAFHLLPQMEKLAYNCFETAQERGVRFFSFIDPKIPKEMLGDAEKIVQTLHHLTQNAIFVTRRGGKVLLEVKVVKKSSNGDCSIKFILKKSIQEQEQTTQMDLGLELAEGLVALMDSQLNIELIDEEEKYFYFTLNFKQSSGNNYLMMSNQRAKVLLLDQSKIDEANILTDYLRSFAVDVIKANQIDETLYDDIDALYIVGDQNDSSWMLELGTYVKKKPIIILLEQQEKLQTKLTHIVDEVIHRPLLPSSVAKYLYGLENNRGNLRSSNMLEFQKEIKALIVEDNLINQRLIQILLETYGITVSTAINGLEALTMAKINSYDIVFMDIDMPEMNGIEATQKIKAALPIKTNLPIVALTAMALEGDKERLLAEGLDDYLSKPLTRVKLEYILKKYLKLGVENSVV